MTDKEELAKELVECDDDLYEQKAAQLWDLLDCAERDTLLCLVKHGPVWDGDLPSKSARSSLFRLGLASRAVVKGEQGYQVANYVGWTVLKRGTSGPPRPPRVTRDQAVKILSMVSDQDNWWEIACERVFDFGENDEDRPYPSIYDVFEALGVPRKDFKRLAGEG